VNSSSKLAQPKLFNRIVPVTAAISLVLLLQHCQGRKQTKLDLSERGYQAPLVMRGGDPYIRALMRTISASESNVSRPYWVIYGGQYVKKLDRHPDICERIPVGPNHGNCSTAAGRYQFITTTWEEMAERYHPDQKKFLFWESYSFEPEYQDRVIYGWLSDPDAWGVDITQLLRDGKIDEVLWLLSGTWTSLGYGIETNSMSRYLPDIYQEVLQEELR
jgi:muramidase (phage lysozyme)